ncbi:hypothetical protein CC1G_01057 [Coprinopsis cinerea okayama7|uniref:Uncharacterized protein n=1 Tax=Coprinopsis cinerea (strain Okayama-7 / 130 / ATCC MYA-4618 / FGSC 9003) TaxID=240176 RepID=A8NED3_COPC7|nr:hypothetical protein CC1G_01057 [Coprinopsis cinerea okayama7\|eukprot:XP_001832995.2 hypothetical protein CC1G_01057 [Coprinopsis cinerea okayama7\
MLSIQIPTLATLLVLPDVLAQTWLYIPGFDPQPVSANIAGVDERGRTTWILQQGQPSAGFTPGVEFVGTATLVEGSQDVSFTYSNSAANFAIGQECTFSDQFALCTIVAQGSTAVQTEFVTRVEVQGGGSTTVDVSPTASLPESSNTPGDDSSRSPTPSPTSDALPETTPADRQSESGSASGAFPANPEPSLPGGDDSSEGVLVSLKAHLAAGVLLVKLFATLLHHDGLV